MRLAAAGILAAATLVGATSPAQAQAVAQASPPEGIVWMALRDINAAWYDPDDPTNRPPLVTTPPEGMIREVVVSNDGRPDWLVDYEAAGLAHFCGTGGCLKRLYVSLGDGYVRAFDRQAFELVIGGRPDGVGIDARVHHLYCADDNRDCRYSYEWDGDARRLIERSNTSVRPMEGEGFTPVGPDER
jgi:hypothetical protein